MQSPESLDATSPIFSIAAAAELAGMHPQTLRQYDRIGLVAPQRTAGNTRRYSMRDVTQLRQVQALSAEGVSLEGIRRVLELENEVARLQDRVHELEGALADELLRREGGRVFAAGAYGVTPLRQGDRPTKRNQLTLWRPFGHR